MPENKFKKQVGFIKNHSSKKNLTLNHNCSEDSSDSFSSFQYNPKNTNQQFSPYRHPQAKSTDKHHSGKVKKQNKPSFSNKQEHPPSFSNLILRNNFVQNTKNHKMKNQYMAKDLQQINKKIKEAKSKISKMQKQSESESEGIQTPKLPNQNSVAQQSSQLSLSNINRFQNEHHSSVANTLPQQNQQQYPKTLAQYNKYLEDSQSSESQHIKNKKTIKHKQKKSKKEQQEELITEWDKRQFNKHKGMNYTIIQHNKNKEKTHHEGVVEAKGGVCFEVDTRQFKTGEPTESAPKKKRKVQVNSKEQIIIRKQTAKRFDRQSRLKLFRYQ